MRDVVEHDNQFIHVGQGSKHTARLNHTNAYQELLPINDLMAFIRTYFSSFCSLGHYYARFARIFDTRLRLASQVHYYCHLCDQMIVKSLKFAHTLPVLAKVWA